MSLSNIVGDSVGAVELMSNQITAIVVGPNELLREGMRALCHQTAASRVVGSASTARDAIRLSQALRPRVAVLGPDLPAAEGIEVAVQIRSMEVPTRLIFVCDPHSESVLHRATQVGIRVVLSTASSAQELGIALRIAADGGKYVTPSLLDKFLDTKASDAASDLTARHKEVLELVVSGRSSKEIACLLDITSKTVDKHRGQLMRRCGAHNVADLVRYAIEFGWVNRRL